MLNVHFAEKQKYIFMMLFFPVFLPFNLKTKKQWKIQP